MHVAELKKVIKPSGVVSVYFPAALLQMLIRVQLKAILCQGLDSVGQQDGASSSTLLGRVFGVLHFFRPLFLLVNPYSKTLAWDKPSHHAGKGGHKKL